MAPLLTVCLGFRNWYVEHLEHGLRSLRSMVGDGCDLEIVVVDTGTESLAVQTTCHRYAALLIHSPQEEWSRAYALNLASRYSHASAHWFVFTDADMIFPNNWLLFAQSYLEKAVHTLILTRSRDLPASPRYVDGGHGRDDARVRTEIEALLAATTPHPDTGQGGGMIVPKEWFRKVRGFDEMYRVWGCEDNDLTIRAKAGGLNVSWLPGTFVAHQWHRRDWPTPEQLRQVDRNREYYFRINWQTFNAEIPIIRNPRGWAGALEQGAIHGT